MAKEIRDRQIKKIRNALSADEQKDFDLGLKVTEKRKDLYDKLAKTYCFSIFDHLLPNPSIPNASCVD